MQDRISAKIGKFRPSLTLSLKARVKERLERGLAVYDFGLGETQRSCTGCGRQLERSRRYEIPDPGREERQARNSQPTAAFSW